MQSHKPHTRRNVLMVELYLVRQNQRVAFAFFCAPFRLDPGCGSLDHAVLMSSRLRAAHLPRLFLRASLVSNTIIHPYLPYSFGTGVGRYGNGCVAMRNHICPKTSLGGIFLTCERSLLSLASAMTHQPYYFLIGTI